MQLTLSGEARLNEDAQDRSLPTYVRVYFLTGVNAIDRASFEDIWLHDEETLGEDLKERFEEAVYPKHDIPVELDAPSSEVRYLAVAAIFREPAGSTWRAVYRLPQIETCQHRIQPRKTTEVTLLVAVKLEANGVTISTDTQTRSVKHRRFGGKRAGKRAATRAARKGAREVAPQRPQQPAGAPRTPTSAPRPATPSTPRLR